MRIVHTADWHAGKMWKGINRLKEVAATLDHLGRFIETEKIDLLLHSGDVFDASVPMAEAERAVFEFFKRVGRAGTQTVVIAGNHDNPARMEAWGLLAELVNVHTIPRPVRPEAGGTQKLTTRGGERAVVAGVPFISVGLLLSATELAVTDGQAFSDYDKGMRHIMRRLSGAFQEDAVNLLIAHTQLEGAILAGSERKATVGKEWATTAQTLPSRAQYIGLGHIHKPQRVDAAPAPTYYAGSVLQMDFGEAGEQKSFVVVDAVAGKPASVERIPYEGTTPLTRVTATLPEIEAQGADLRNRGYLEVTVSLERHDPELNTKIRRLLSNAVSVRQQYPEQQRESSVERTGLSPRELFSLYYKQRDRGVPSGAVLAAFDELYRQASADSET